MVGVLLIQDLLALAALVFLAGFGASGNSPGVFDFLLVFLKGRFFCRDFLYGQKRHSRFDKNNRQIAGTFVSVKHRLGAGYSVSFFLFLDRAFAGNRRVFGGHRPFVFRRALSNPFAHQAAARFFIIVFFIVLGSTLALGDISEIWPTVAVFSLFVLIGNPLIVMILMGLLGYKKNEFLSGITMAQISEFSFVLMQLSRGVGHFGESEVSLITLVGIVTITGSTYLIIYGDRLYSLLSPLLSVLKKTAERKKR